jgi:hypothetical protein
MRSKRSVAFPRGLSLAVTRSTPPMKIASFVSCVVMFFVGLVTATAQESWDGEASGVWGNPTNWDTDTVPDPGDDVSFDDLAAMFSVNLGSVTRSVGTANFASDSTPYILSAGTLDLSGDLEQDGEAAVNLANIGLALPSGMHELAGAGDGLMTLGTISGLGSLEVTGTGAEGFLLNATNSSFAGGLVVSDGLLSVHVSSGSIAIPAATATSSRFGNVSVGGITINGGTLQLTATGSSSITTTSDAVQIAFESAGGTLDLDGPISASTPFNFAVRADEDTPAVVKHAVANSWVRTSGVNIGALPDIGSLRLELTNGALAALFTTSTVQTTVTVAGVPGGTSATAGDTATTAGKFLVEPSLSASTLALAETLTFNDAVQVSASVAAQSIDGNLLVASGADVAFQGRATGSAAHQALTLGVGGNDTLTIEDGAQANIDAGFRSTTNNGFVVLNATTIIEAGGTLRFRRTNASPAGSSVPHSWVGDVIGRGTTASEAIVDIALDVAATGSSAVNPDAAQAIVIEGTGLGGLRVVATGSVATQTSSQRLANYFTTARTSAITGTGGYLTIAPSNAAFNFTQSHQWNDPDIGLRVENTVSGDDLTFDDIFPVTFLRPLHVGPGAQVNVSNDALGGFVTGTGTLVGIVHVLAGGRLAPGLAPGSLGTLTFAKLLTLDDGALFTFDLAAPGLSDLVAVGGALGLNNTEFGDFTSNPLAGFDDGTYTLFTATSLIGSLGSNLSGPIGLRTGTLSINGNSLILTVVPEPASGALFALGLSTLALRRRRQLMVTSSPASLPVS